jgi:hypothetical protein
MKNKILAVGFVVAAAGCSSDDSSEASSGVQNEVNACATKGSTYLSQYVEHAGGTCGPIADEIINIDDPAITAATCASVTQENCVGRGTACKSSGNGCSQSLSYMTTFASDGSSAASVMTIKVSCADGSHCTSTYDATMTRQ